MLNLLRSLDLLTGQTVLRLIGLLNKALRPVRDPRCVFSPQKFLCVKLWGLGNLVLIAPLLATLKRRFPACHITFLTFDLNRGFLENREDVDRIIYFRFSRNILRIVGDFGKLALALRKEKIDVSLNFETFNNASALFSLLTAATVRIGLNNAWEKSCYTHPVEHDRHKHISEVFADLLGPLDIRPRYAYANLRGTEGDQNTVKNLLERKKIDRFICVHPGTSDNFRGKRYPAGRLAGLCGLLGASTGLPFVFVGTRSDSDTTQEILAEIPKANLIVDLTTRLCVGELTELIRRSSLFVSGDSGPAHIAASLGIPTVTFFGPTSPRRYGPLHDKGLVLYNNSTCSPCVGTGPFVRSCARNHACLDFSPQDVLRQITERFFHEENRQLLATGGPLERA